MSNVSDESDISDRRTQKRNKKAGFCDCNNEENKDIKVLLKELDECVREFFGYKIDLFVESKLFTNGCKTTTVEFEANTLGKVFIIYTFVPEEITVIQLMNNGSTSPFMHYSRVSLDMLMDFIDEFQN